MGDVAAAMQDFDDTPLRPKSSLMKKLSFLLHPKKSKSKSGSPSQKPAAAASFPPPATAAAGTSELELLFAQAEATLGELLVRAGASFEARSSSYSHADQHLHRPVRGTDPGNDQHDVSAVIGGSSGSRSAKFSGQGHARRRSLSRVWQQLGGSLFCGSGHMSGYVMDQDMMAPVPSKGLYEDVVLDEAYWQSLADAILLQQQRQQQQQQDAKLAAGDAHGQQDLSCRTAKEGQNDQQQPRVRDVENLRIAEGEDCEAEIVPSIDVDGVAKLWSPAECGSTSSTGRSSGLQDMDSIYYRNLVGSVESGGGCTRLNTTLDESPNLAHNYLNLKVGGTSSAWNRDSGEEANSRRDINVEVRAVVSGGSSMQPLERFLWQARSVGGPSSPSSRSAPESLTCQEPAGVESTGTTSCRVSLMTLLHEEAAAGDSTPTLDARQEEAETEAAAAAAVEGVRSWRSTMQIAPGEDPLQCCVCMIRRKGAALIPCGHTFCRTCAKQLFAGRGACPLCNNLIAQVLDIF